VTERLTIGMASVKLRSYIANRPSRAVRDRHHVHRLTVVFGQHSCLRAIDSPRRYVNLICLLTLPESVLLGYHVSLLR
jgi:hypothetical protein